MFIQSPTKEEAALAIVRKIGKYGNSSGLLLPQPVMEMLGWETGIEIEMRVEGERLILSRAGSPPARHDATTPEEPKKRRPPKS
jgi:antitoxin component of MazEF toxin-antitoxin module